MLVCGVGAGFCYLYTRHAISCILSYIPTMSCIHLYLVRTEVYFDQSLQVEGKN